MPTLLTWLLAAAPFALGASTATMLLRRQISSGGLYGLIAACGGLLGYLGWVGVLLAGPRFGVNLLSDTGIYLTAALGIVALFPLVTQTAKLGAAPTRPTTIQLLLIAALVGYDVYFINLVSLVPPAGWDTLWSWAEISNSYLSYAASSPTEAWGFQSTHPNTVAILGAWSSWVREFFEAAGPVYAPWFFVFLSAQFAVIGYVKHASGALTPALLAGLALTSLPLLQDHVVVGGYSEIFLMATVICGAATAAIGLQINSKALIVLSLLLAASCIAYKNIGLLYGACVAGGALLVALLNSLKYRTATLIAMGIAATCGVLFLVWLDNQAGSTVSIGSRSLQLQLSNLQGIPLNEYYSLVVNQSFHVAAALLLLPIPFVVRTFKLERGYELLPWVISWLILGMLLASQLTDYGYLYALPGNDTGNSRFSLISIGTAILSLATISKQSDGNAR